MYNYIELILLSLLSWKFFKLEFQLSVFENAEMLFERNGGLVLFNHREWGIFFSFL